MYDVYEMRRTNIYLDDEELAALQLLGRRQGRPVAALVREAIDAWLTSQGVSRVDDDEWARRFGALLDRRRQAATVGRWRQVDVERDIADAIGEVRSDRAASRH
jgi:hypothetical protein